VYYKRNETRLKDSFLIAKRSSAFADVSTRQVVAIYTGRRRRKEAAPPRADTDGLKPPKEPSRILSTIAFWMTQ
jgi:hypothetical protein